MIFQAHPTANRSRRSPAERATRSESFGGAPIEGSARRPQHAHRGAHPCSNTTSLAFLRETGRSSWPWPLARRSASPAVAVRTPILGSRAGGRRGPVRAAADSAELPPGRRAPARRVAAFSHRAARPRARATPAPKRSWSLAFPTTPRPLSVEVPCTSRGATPNKNPASYIRRTRRCSRSTSP